MKFASAFSFRHLAIAAVTLLSFGTVNSFGAKSFVGFYYALIGPFAGGASRDWQSCCTEFSVTVFMFSGPVLLFGFLVQLIPHLQGGKGVLRFLIWAIAWVAWCFSAWVSFGHAAE
jgi:hypothetical protein